MATGSKSARITPLLGEAFLTSAIKAGWVLPFFKAAKKSLGGGTVFTCLRNSSKGKRSRCLSTSFSLCQTIFSRILRGLASGIST